MPANSPAPSAVLAPGNAVKLNVLHKGPGQGRQPDAPASCPNTVEAKADTDTDKGGTTKGVDVPKLGHERLRLPTASPAPARMASW